MKTRSIVLAGVTAGCMIGMVLFPNTAAAVSDEEFNALKNQVQEMSQKVQTLEKTNQQDQQQIQQLKQQLGETQTTVQTVAAKEQPVPAPSSAQDAKHNFTMVGDAEVAYVSQHGQNGSNGKNGSFELADFAPIFLYRANDNILFEAGFDIRLNNNDAPTAATPTVGGSSTSVSMSFAQLDYMYNDYVTFVAGDMLLPLGTYSERGAGWLNKVPDDPLVRAILPGTGVGAQVRGAVPLGESGQSITYAIYGVNGPSSTDSSAASGSLDLGGNVGMYNSAFAPNWHSDPSGGARIGWFFPWKPHYDLELGVAGQSGEWDNTGGRNWSAGVVDAALHISPYFELKGEYVNTWYDTEFPGANGFSGTIQPHGWWIQGAYKLSGLQWELPFINNAELVNRYDTLNDGMGTLTDRYTVGGVYYLTNTLQFKGCYEFNRSVGPAAIPFNDYILELSYGF